MQGGVLGAAAAEVGRKLETDPLLGMPDAAALAPHAKVQSNGGRSAHGRAAGPRTAVIARHAVWLVWSWVRMEGHAHARP